MDISEIYEAKDRLDYVQAMLRSLCKLVDGAASPYLRYFLDMAAEQARHEAQLAEMKSPVQQRIAS